MRAIAIALSLGIFIAFLVAAALLIPPFGYLMPPPENCNAQLETEAGNIILLNYRGFDMLGKVIVLLAAAIGVVMLLTRQGTD